MKKSFLLITPFIALTLALNSCKKCYTCTLVNVCLDCSNVQGGQSNIICKDEYEASGASTTISWNQYRGALLSNGCVYVNNNPTKEVCSQNDKDLAVSNGYTCVEK